MSKVWLATSGEYSDYQVRHVFTREEDARAYALADDVREMDLREGRVEVRTRYGLLWWPLKPDCDGDGTRRVPNPSLTSGLEDYDPAAPAISHRWHGPPTPYLFVGGWDRARVMKVYSEQRAKHLAEAQGL